MRNAALLFARARLLALATTVSVAALTLPSPAAAQDESALRSSFEGRRVVLRMDMPGSADGVNLRVDGTEVMDYQDYRNDLKRYGIAIRAGDSVVVTLVRVKKDLIEFQLGGGGFGTFGDDTSTSSNVRLIDKSEREKQLERRIRDEKDRDERRALQRELDDLRDRRERENRRLRAQSERIEEAKRERIAEERLHGGSRFNLRYTGRVPEDIRPEQIVTALTEYVDFRGGDARGEYLTSAPTGDISQLRKGMLRDEAERTFGRPIEFSEKREGGVVVTTLVFDIGEQRVTAVFVEDVLVRYTVSSK